MAIKQAVLFAAGQSTRTFPLTVNKPKPLLQAAGIQLLEHNLLALEGIVDEVILIIGFESEQLKEFCDSRKGKKIKIRYVQQTRQLGTAHALLQAQPYIKGAFLAINGDDFYSALDLAKLAAKGSAVLGMQVSAPHRFGVIVTKSGKVSEIVEKPVGNISDIANTGAYSLTPAIFDVLKSLKKSASGEYYLTDAIKIFASQNPVSLELVKDYWLPIGYPWDLLSANEFFLNRNKKSIISANAIVEKGATLKGVVIVGAKTIIKSGAYIEGPVFIGSECVIGPNCYIRPFTTIGNNCKIGNACEIKNTIIGEHTHIAHLSYVGDSVIGRHVNFGAATIVANLRHDKGIISSMVNGVLTPTGRTKLGTIIGDFAKTGINSSIYPGRKIWPYKMTMPGEVVNKDLM